MAKDGEDILKEEKKESFLSLPDIKIYYKSIVIITRLHW